MSPISSRGSPPTPEGRRFLDVLDGPVYSTSLGASLVYIRRGTYTQSGGGQGLCPVLESAGGWLSSLFPFQGGLWAEATSAAATRNTRSTSRFIFPIGFNLSLAPERSRVPLRFQLESVLFRTTPLVALAPLAFGVGWHGGVSTELSDTNVPGYELVSRTDVNGGRWTVRVRLVTAGALTVVQDTGLDPATTPQIHAALRYDSTLAPRLSFVVNGIEYGILAGIANIPTPTAGLQIPGMVQGLSAGGGVGQVDRSRQGRFYVEEL